MRVYRDLRRLRRDVVALIERRRYRFTRHASSAHPELSESQKLHVIRFGGRDSPDRGRPLRHAVYVCWFHHPRLGLCRGVYGVVDSRDGPYVRIITAFTED